MWLPATLQELCVYALCAVGLALAWFACNPVARYKYRHIPGPFAWPGIGNLIPISTKYQHVYFMQLRERYGPIFKVWYGAAPWVIICEADSIRKVAYKCNNRFDLPHTMLGTEKYLMTHNLLILRSDTWRQVKKAWDPATMHRSSLEGYAPLMHECGQQLVERLRGVQQRGEVVDIWAELCKMTLEVVGTCAFGIRFSGKGPASASGQATDDGWGETRPRLLDGLKKFFRSQELDKASKWVLAVLAFPPVADFFRCLAYLLPDEGHRHAVESQVTMMECSRKILAASRAQRQREESERAAREGGVDVDASWAAAKAAAEGEKQGGKGVLPGSFVMQLEAWKSKYEGEKDVSDDLLAAQVNTFLLGGYETTANAMAFLLYFLSTHPEAQERLQQEVDDVLGARAPTLEDIPKLVYLDACIKEAMRLRPPAVTLIRSNEMPEGGLDILGLPIPTGATMAMFIFGLHRDPAYWERVEEYLPERFLPESGGKLGPFNENAYLPFGAGGRKCVGYKFAEQEMMLVVACLFQNFTFTRPAGEGPLHAKTGLTHSPIGGVNVLVGGRG